MKGSLPLPRPTVKKRPKINKQEYLTPSGRKLMTQSEYLDEWEKFNNKLISKLGDDFVITGFDPQISLCLICNNIMLPNSSVQIPLWFAKRIINEI